MKRAARPMKTVGPTDAKKLDAFAAKLERTMHEALHPKCACGAESQWLIPKAPMSPCYGYCDACYRKMSGWKYWFRRFFACKI